MPKVGLLGANTLHMGDELVLATILSPEAAGAHAGSDVSADGRTDGRPQHAKLRVKLAKRGRDLVPVIGAVGITDGDDVAIRLEDAVLLEVLHEPVHALLATACHHADTERAVEVEVEDGLYVEGVTHDGDRLGKTAAAVKRVEVVDDLDSIFDSSAADEPTLARSEMTGSRPSAEKAGAVASSITLDSSDAEGLSPDQESVPTDLLSSQWQMDSGIWDETATKLDLARAYIEMDDGDAAREILEEVISEGREEQRSEARAMLEKLA